MLLDAKNVLVLDFSADAVRGIESIWALGAGLQLQPSTRQAGSFVTTPDTNGVRLHIAMASTTAISTERLRGSTDPFGGWTVLGGQPTPVDALKLSSPAATASIASFFHLDSAEFITQLIGPLAPDMKADSWTLTLLSGPDRIEVSRQGDHLATSRNGMPGSELKLSSSPPYIDAQRLALRESYQLAVAQFAPWRDLSVYRKSLTLKLLAVWLALEMLWFGLKQLSPITAVRHARSLKLGAVIFWLSIAIYLHSFYFK
ncbi:MAG: hypothetical protein IPO19_00315 [Rhodoferax sp.]|nr:hypothetical protein [Rhodoferax sp.]